MSVINQMLRDLDAREAGTKERAGLPSRLRPLPPIEKQPLQSWRMLALGIGIGALAAVVITSILLSGEGAPPATPPAPPALPAAVSNEPPIKLATQMAEAASPAPARETGKTASPAMGAAAKPASTQMETIRTARQQSLQADTPTAEKKPAVSAPELPVLPLRPARELGADAQIDKQPRGGQVREQAEGEYRKGMQAVKRGDHGAAIPLFQRALELDPMLVKARQALLSVLVGGKQWSAARQVAEGGLAVDPGQSGWAIILARLQFEQGEIASAVETLTRHAAHAGGDADYQGLFAYFLQKQQRPAEAAERFRAALALRPGEGRWWFGLGLALEAAGRSKEATEAYARARETGNLPVDMATVAEQKLRQAP